MGHDQSKGLVNDLTRQFESWLSDMKYEYHEPVNILEGTYHTFGYIDGLTHIGQSTDTT